MFSFTTFGQRLKMRIAFRRCRRFDRLVAYEAVDAIVQSERLGLAVVFLLCFGVLYGGG